jgi:thioredoxin reductase
VEEVVWDMMWMTGVKLKSWKTLEAEWIFVAIWTLPKTELVDKFNPEKDSEWCLIVGKNQETSIKWIFAAGDITTNSNKVRQTLTSAAEGAVAASWIHEELMKG